MDLQPFPQLLGRKEQFPFRGLRGFHRKVSVKRAEIDFDGFCADVADVSIDKVPIGEPFLAADKDQLEEGIDRLFCLLKVVLSQERGEVGL